MYQFSKCTSESLDFIIDFSLLTNDSIVNAVWDIPSELLIDSISKDFTTATIFLSQGLPNSIYRCSSLVTTELGRAIRIEFGIQIVERHDLESRRMLYDHEARSLFYVHPRDLGEVNSEWIELNEVNPRKMKVIPQDNIRTMGV